MNKYVRCILVDQAGFELAGVIAHVQWSEVPDEEPDIHWLHVLSGRECMDLEQAFEGWIEPDPVADELWAALLACISDDETLLERLVDADSRLTYDYC